MKKLILIVIAIVILISGIVLIKKKKEELASLHPPKIYPVIVKTIKPKVSNFILSLTALGIIKSGADVNISTKMASKILYVKPLGSKVVKGEIIVKLDSSSTQSRILGAKSMLVSLYSKLSSAKLSLKNMILTHKRTKRLLGVNGASIEQYQKESDTISNIKSNIDNIKSQIATTKSTIKELKTLLSYTIIKSPVNGVVSKQFMNIGDVSMPGKPICEISSKKDKYILVRLPDNIHPKGIIFNGKFYDIFPLNSTIDGLNEYKADINTNLNTGSRVEVSVIIFRGKAVELPNNAVLNDNGANYVLEVRKNRAIPIAIKILASGEEGIAINNSTIEGKDIVVAKPDILIKLLGGVEIIKER